MFGSSYSLQHVNTFGKIGPAVGGSSHQLCICIECDCSLVELQVEPPIREARLLGHTIDAGVAPLADAQTAQNVSDNVTQDLPYHGAFC